MHVISVSIKNLRSIASTELRLNDPRSRELRFPNVNVILGDNGSGKSTLLRAVGPVTARERVDGTIFIAPPADALGVFGLMGNGLTMMVLLE